MIINFLARPISTFVVLEEPEPDWADPAAWKRLKVFPGRSGSKVGSPGIIDPYTAATTDSVSDQIRTQKKVLGIETEKVLHGGRRGGSRAVSNKLNTEPGVSGK